MTAATHNTVHEPRRSEAYALALGTWFDLFFITMKTQEKLTPAQVADECEMLAQQECDGGDREAAALFMTPCHAIRQLLRTLARLNERVHSGYDFNADPDGMTLEVGDLLAGKDAILDGDRIDWLDENRANLSRSPKNGTRKTCSGGRCRKARRA